MRDGTWEAVFSILLFSVFTDWWVVLRLAGLGTGVWRGAEVRARRQPSKHTKASSCVAPACLREHFRVTLYRLTDFPRRLCNGARVRPNWWDQDHRGH